MNRWVGTADCAKAMFVLSCVLLALTFGKLLYKHAISKWTCCKCSRNKTAKKAKHKAEEESGGAMAGGAAGPSAGAPSWAVAIASQVASSAVLEESK